MIIISYEYNYSSLIKGLAYVNSFMIQINNITAHTMFRSMLAKFVPLSIRTITDSIREALFLCGYMLSGAMIKPNDSHTGIMLISYVCVILVVTIWMLLHWRSYLDIKVIVLTKMEDLDKEKLLKE